MSAKQGQWKHRKRKTSTKAERTDAKEAASASETEEKEAVPNQTFTQDPLFVEIPLSAVSEGNQHPFTLSREGAQDPLPDTSIHIRGEDCLPKAGRDNGKVCLLVFGDMDASMQADGPAS